MVYPFEYYTHYYAQGSGFKLPPPSSAPSLQGDTFTSYETGLQMYIYLLSISLVPVITMMTIKQNKKLEKN